MKLNSIIFIFFLLTTPFYAAEIDSAPFAAKESVISKEDFDTKNLIDLFDRTIDRTHYALRLLNINVQSLKNIKYIESIKLTEYSKTTTSYAAAQQLNERTGGILGIAMALSYINSIIDEHKIGPVLSLIIAEDCIYTAKNNWYQIQYYTKGKSYLAFDYTKSRKIVNLINDFRNGHGLIAEEYVIYRRLLSNISFYENFIAESDGLKSDIYAYIRHISRNPEYSIQRLTAYKNKLIKIYHYADQLISESGSNYNIKTK